MGIRELAMLKLAEEANLAELAMQEARKDIYMKKPYGGDGGLSRAGRTVWMNANNMPETMQDSALFKKQGYPQPQMITDKQVAKMKPVNTNPSLSTKLNMFRNDFIDPKVTNAFGKTIPFLKTAGRTLPFLGTAAMIAPELDWKNPKNAFLPTYKWDEETQQIVRVEGGN